MNSEYVIIGNSAAAVGAVEAIRKNDSEGSIVIFSSEVYHTYSRPLISYYNLGKVSEEGMKYRGTSFYDENSCDFRPGEKIVRIDPVARKVFTEKGDEVIYSKLLAATGSSPSVPPFPGLESVENKMTYTTFDDAKKLDELLDQGISNVLIVGAGLIGLKCAEGIGSKAKITCVDLSDRVLSSILDDDASAYIKKHVERQGVELILGSGIKSFEGNKATLSDGSVLGFDVLVIASGVRPQTGLLADIGALTRRGIVIDEHCRTSVDHIYAAGDCVESMDCSSGDYKVMALLPNAYMQGECAGMNMSGKDYVFDKAIPMNALTLFGLHLITAGSYTGECLDGSEGHDYRKFYISENRLNGFILIGKIDKAGIYTSLIREKTPLDTIDFELVRRSPGLIAFSREFRDKTLGGNENGY